MSSSDSQQRCFYVFAHSISSDSQAKKKFDELDEFNRPRLRQSLIIASIAAAAPSADDIFDESLPIFSIQYPSAPVVRILRIFYFEISFFHGIAFVRRIL